MTLEEEIKSVYDLITHPAGYDVGCSGLISIRRYEYPKWAVEWEERSYLVNCPDRLEVLEFDDPMKAAECFVDLRHQVYVGLDYDSEEAKLLLIHKRPSSRYLLGKNLEKFKKKYI